MNRIKKQTQAQRLELAKNYKDFIRELGLFEGYKKSLELSDKIGGRTFRTIVEDILYLYSYGCIDFLIISNPTGYKASRNLDEIENYLKTKKHQALSLLSNYNTLKRAMQLRPQMTIDEVMLHLSSLYLKHDNLIISK